MNSKGYVQVYTGNGKGKTSAALGVILRAAGAGYNSLLVQFMKEFPYSEILSLKKFEHLIEVKQFGTDKFIFENRYPNKVEIERICDGLQFAKEMMLSAKYKIIVLDEACVSIYFKLLEESDLLSLINSKPYNVELIITGRYCPESIIEIADLVTEMKEIKHYYSKGVLSRKGIDS